MIQGLELNNMAEAEQFWDKSADGYDKTEQRFELIHARARELARGHLNATDLVLDYGSGTGTAACELADRVSEIQGIDISHRMVELARAKAAEANVSNVTFTQGDIFDEKHAPSSIDVVLAFNMLHTVPNPEAVMKRIFELLKPGGKLLTVTPLLGGKMSLGVRLQIQVARVLGRLGVIPIPIRRLRKSDLDTLMSSVPLRVIESEEIFSGASSYFVAATRSEGVS